MIRMRLFSVAVLVPLVFGCEGETGPMGLQGPQGPQGPPGPGEKWEYVGFMPRGLDPEEFYIVDVPHLTLAERPVVLVYAEVPGYGWFALPQYEEVDGELWTATYYYDDGFVALYLAGGVHFMIVVIQ